MKDTGCTASAAFTGITDVRAIDDTTVWVGFDAPTPYPYTAFVGLWNAHHQRSPVRRLRWRCCGVGDHATSRTWRSAGHRSVQDYVSFKTNEEAVYERNPFYRGPEPYFDKVVMKGGGDAISAARAVLEDGEADYAWNLQVDPEVLGRMEAAGNGKVVSGFAGLVEQIFVNQTNPDQGLGEDRSEYLDGQNPHPFLTFTAIPQAMSMAIDRGHIAGEL